MTNVQVGDLLEVQYGCEEGEQFPIVIVTGVFMDDDPAFNVDYLMPGDGAPSYTDWTIYNREIVAGIVEVWKLRVDRGEKLSYS